MVSKRGCSGERKEGVPYRIHWGSSVMVSPGVTMALVLSLGRLEGGAMSMSPSESREQESESSLW